MDWQQMSALAIVALAAILLAWGRFRPGRRLRGKSPCGGCGASVAPKESVVFHARKGERPEVRIRPASAAKVPLNRAR